MPPHLFPILLVAALLPTPTCASAGISVFLQNAELVPLACSLTGLVFLTILFELGIHAVKHRVEAQEDNFLMLHVLQKINAELTVLGFISIIVVLVANGFAGDPALSAYLPEVEVAHVWLFFVGLLYVVEALVFLGVARAARAGYTIADKLPLDDWLDDFGGEPAVACRVLCGCESKAYGVAQHKLYKRLFEHFHWREIDNQIGRADNFDFAEYMACSWEHLVISLQEIPIAPWCAFLVVFWLVVAQRHAEGILHDTSTIGTAVTLNLLVFAAFCALNLEQSVSLWRVNTHIAKVVTGMPGATLEDAMECVHGWEKSAEGTGGGGAGLDGKPDAAASPASSVSPSSSSSAKQLDPRRLGDVLATAPPPPPYPHTASPPPPAILSAPRFVLPPQQSIRHRARFDAITRAELRRRTCLSIRVKRVVFSMLFFIHAFLYGWFIFLSWREVDNTTLYFGAVPAVANSSSSTGSGSSDGHRRMLLSSSSSSSSSASPSHDADGWFTCAQFRDAGSPHIDGKPRNSWRKQGSYLYLDGYNGHAEHICTVHNQAVAVPFVTILTFLPLLLTTLWIIPLFLQSFAYQKAVVGSDGHDKQLPHRPGRAPTHASNGAVARGSGDAHRNHHHRHSVSHGGGSCIADAFFGHDDTTFSVIIKDVCHAVVEEKRAIDYARTKLIKALMEPRWTGLAGGPATIEWLRHKSATDTQARLVWTHAAGLESGPEVLHAAEQKAIADEKGKTYAEILESRGRRFYEFLQLAAVPNARSRSFRRKQMTGKVAAAAAAALKMRVVSLFDLLLGIRAISVWRRGGDHQLTHVCEAHCLRGLDRDGNKNLDEQEFLEFLLARHKAKVPVSLEKQKQELLLNCSPAELVEMLVDARQRLRAAGLLVAGEAYR